MAKTRRSPDPLLFLNLFFWDDFLDKFVNDASNSCHLFYPGNFQISKTLRDPTKFSDFDGPSLSKMASGANNFKAVVK